MTDELAELGDGRAGDTDSMSTGPQAEQIEWSVKALALFAAALSSAGFLIVSLHDGSYGFSPANPFRPRTIAAGFLFFLFIAISIAIPYISLFVVGRWGVRGAITKWDVLLAAVPLMVAGVSTTFCLIQPFAAIQILAGASGSGTETAVALAASLSFVSLFASAGLSNIWRATVKVSALAATVLFGSELFSLYPYRDLFVLCVWISMATCCFFAATVWWRLKGALLSPGAKNNFILMMLPTALYILYFFAQVPYPHIAAKWGGGKPVQVAITFAKDTFRPGVVTKVLLIEETDLGFYVSDREDSPAHFVPRSSVGGIEYTPNLFYRVPATRWDPAEATDLFK